MTENDQTTSTSASTSTSTSKLSTLSSTIEEEDESVKALANQPIQEIFFVTEEESASSTSTSTSSNDSVSPSETVETVPSIESELDNYLLTVYNNQSHPDYQNDTKLDEFVTSLEKKLKVETKEKNKISKQQIKEQKIEAKSSRSDYKIKKTLDSVASEWIDATINSYKILRSKYEIDIEEFNKKYSNSAPFYPSEARVEMGQLLFRHKLYVSKVDESIVIKTIKAYAHEQVAFVENEFKTMTLDEKVKILKSKLKSFDISKEKNIVEILKPYLQSKTFNPRSASMRKSALHNPGVNSFKKF